MALLNDVGQCTCGIIFESPECYDFTQHLASGQHQRCLAIEVCGPCFMGLCAKCEKGRRNDTQLWKCRCLHDYPLIFDEAVVSVLSITVTWSEWLESGRQSSVTLGIEEKPIP